jgi:hypothetical protein
VLRLGVVWGLSLLAQPSLAPVVTRQAGKAEGEQREAGGVGDGLLTSIGVGWICLV